MVDCTFYKSTIKSNCILLLCHVYVRSSRQEMFCKKGVLKNFESPGTLLHCCFPVNFAKFLRTPFLTEHLCWLLLALQNESTLYSFRTSCSKQAQYLKFKLTVTSWKYSRSNSSNKFSLLCFRLLETFNENVLLQRGLDKYFWEKVSISSVNFFLLESKY